MKALYNSLKAKFYEQLLPNGIKEIDIGSCNLNKEEKYTFVGFTENNKIEQVTLKK